jgi:hypothetical protein
MSYQFYVMDMLEIINFLKLFSSIIITISIRRQENACFCRKAAKNTLFCWGFLAGGQLTNKRCTGSCI